MAITNNDVKKLSDAVALLQQDMAQVNSLVDFVSRLDTTIEKLTEVSSRVSELLAVQGMRLENQEKVAEKIQVELEKRRVEADASIKDVYMRVERVESDLYDEIKSSQDKVLTEVKEMRAESVIQHNEMKGKVQRLEKWMWTVIGSVSAAIFVIELGIKFIQ